jgi:ATPase subunit of ABC transporter with duplicated ATPase domains
VGVNGCGKSTLLKLLAGGQLPIPPSWNVFLVGQHLPAPVGDCPVEEVLSADVRRLAVLKEISTLEAALAISLEGDDETAYKLNARLLELHNEASLWDDAEKEITHILVSLGFSRSTDSGSLRSEPSIRTPMTELSGGWRMKVQLAKALWLQPKLMLLDEPSNHLDFQALEYLEERLKQYPHTIVVVSHDVAFLHNVSKDILWMKDQKIESLPHDAVSQEDLLRMQRRRALNIRFSTPKGTDAANEGLSLHGVEFSHGGSVSSSRGTCLLKTKKEIRFSGKSRSVLLGKNGSGKSTFLDLCAGKLSPNKGSIDRTPELKIGHYSQLTDDLDRNSTESAATYLVRECAHELATHGGSTRTTRLRGAVVAKSNGEDCQCVQKQLTAKASAHHKRLLEIARGYLTSFGFDGDVAISVPVDRLSGGQKALLKLAVLSLRPVHILLLDEPTNHLDAEACESLAKGLSEFEGGIVAVTHDELLMYRLIHCNWTSSELLICRGRSVWSERNFGAHCLNALKHEVHRAEHDESSSKPQEENRLERSRDAKQPPAQNVAVSEGGLPPWLRSRRRKRIEKNDVQIDASMAKQGEEPEVDVCQPLEGKMNSTTRRPSCGLQEENHVNIPIHTSLPVEPDLKNLGSWEDKVDSDATTEAPEASEGEDKAAKCVIEFELSNTRDNDDLLLACPSNDGGKSPLQHGRQSNHSRFRKDLVNLNKAVKKRMQAGSFTDSQLIDFIKRSAVGRHLRTVHGHEFDENRFVNDILHYAKKM